MSVCWGGVMLDEDGGDFRSRFAKKNQGKKPAGIWVVTHSSPPNPSLRPQIANNQEALREWESHSLVGAIY